jgi:hypothetical protein
LSASARCPASVIGSPIDGCSRIAAPGAPGKWPGVAARARQEAPPARRDRRGRQHHGPRLRPPGRDRIEPRPK